MGDLLTLVVTRIGQAIRRTLAFSILLLVLAVGVDVAGALLFRYPPILIFVLHDLPFRGETFDPGTWSSAGSCEGLSDYECFEKEAACLRGGMVRDLITQHLTPGDASRETIARLIGPAEYEVRIEGRNCDGYALGMCSGLRWGYDSLYVCYRQDGRVDRAGHVQH